MKILAFTDIHLSSIALNKIKSKIKMENPDLLVCAGDLTIFEQGLDIVLSKLSKLKKKILLIHGNHETEALTRRICKEYNNLVFIHKNFYKYDECLFLGYGGGGFSLREPRFYLTGRKFRKIIKKNYDKKIVFITHAPPYGTKVDLIVGEHCGNKTYRDFIAKNKVDLYICGHLHENFNKKDNLKKTLIVNPGPYGKIIKI
ncbi:metallophosphoesterase [Candidatus Woesearchaeota archaeon]|nr:metallophosphoesterase [Candidatus Woesearchaeota archaeon]